jgi:hypothetical protein
VTGALPEGRNQHVGDPQVALGIIRRPETRVPVSGHEDDADPPTTVLDNTQPAPREILLNFGRQS